MTDSTTWDHWLSKAWEAAGAIPAPLARSHLADAERAAHGLQAVLDVLRADVARHACDEPELLSQRIRSGLLDAAGVLAAAVSSELSAVREAPVLRNAAPASDTPSSLAAA